MIPANRILNKLDNYYRTAKLRDEYLEPLEEITDQLINALPAGLIKTEKNLHYCKILCLLKTFPYLCNRAELQPTLEALVQQLEATAIDDLELHEQWEDLKNIPHEVGLGMANTEFSAFLFEEPEILAHYLHATSDSSVGAHDLFSVADVLADKVYAALDNLEKYERSVLISFPEWKELIQISLKDYLVYMYFAHRLEHLYNGPDDKTKHESESAAITAVAAEMGIAKKAIVASVAKFYQALLIQLLANASVSNTESSLAERAVSGRIEDIHTVLDVAKAWNEAHEDDCSEEESSRWFISFCSNAMPGSWEPTDRLYNHEESPLNVPDLIVLIRNREQRVLEMCQSLQVRADDVETLLIQYLTHITGLSEEDIDQNLPPSASANDSITGTLLRAFEVLELEGFESGEYNLLGKLQTSPSVETSRIIEGILGARLPEFINNAKEILSGHLRASIETPESEVLNSLIKTTEERIRQATVIKEMTEILAQRFGDSQLLENVSKIFVTIIRRFTEKLGEQRKRLSEVDGGLNTNGV